MIYGTNYRKTILFLLSVIAFLTRCPLLYADIIEIDSLEQAQDQLLTADTTMLVIFDMDLTLLAPTEKMFYLGCRDINDYDLSDRDLVSQMIKNLKEMCPSQNSAGNLSKFNAAVCAKIHFTSVEAITAPLIKQLQAHGIKIIVLTNRYTGPYGSIKRLQDWHVENLHEVGLDFSPSFPVKEIVFENFESKNTLHPLYYHGILCSVGNPKGKVLATFLDKINLKPHKIIFFDDSYQCCKSVADEMGQRAIPTQCYYYKAIYKEKIKLDHTVTQYQFDHWIKHEEFLTEKEVIEKLAKRSNANLIPKFAEHYTLNTFAKKSMPHQFLRQNIQSSVRPE